MTPYSPKRADSYTPFGEKVPAHVLRAEVEPKAMDTFKPTHVFTLLDDTRVPVLVTASSLSNEAVEEDGTSWVTGYPVLDLDWRCRIRQVQKVAGVAEVTEACPAPAPLPHRELVDQAKLRVLAYLEKPDLHLGRKNHYLLAACGLHKGGVCWFNYKGMPHSRILDRALQELRLEGKIELLSERQWYRRYQR